jgi:phospholipid/cholesterol/gamma-HCH transport system substrate-binding protein
MKRAIKAHLSDFIAILVLIVFAVGISGFILTEERLKLPFVSQPTYSINAAFNTAQAFTPGQGQRVTVSGVQIGLVGQVKLNQGIALVQLNIDKRYQKLVHEDATALARPRTGLQDMFVELSPGSPPSPVAPPGFTIPVSNTLPELESDEVLSALDADTRQYLQLLVNGAGQGLSKNGTQLAQVFERFAPTHQDLARLNGALAERGRDLQQLINSLRRLNVALVAKRVQIGQLVVSSSKVFRAFAREDANVSRAVADLPGTLEQTTTTLGQVETFANLLGPTATHLLPAVRDIPNANHALIQLANPAGATCGTTGAAQQQRSACEIVRDQIRPFVRASRPVVRDLRPAAVNLAAATPNLANVFTVLNHFFNQLGYNTEPSGQHGYLWWLAWLNHNARTLFSIQDANGDYRPLFIQANCNTYGQLLSFNPSAVAILSPVLSKLCNLP